MARFRRRTRRRFNRKRKRSVSTRSLAYRSLRKVSRLARRVRPEIKFHDVSISQIMSPAGIVETPLGGISHVIPQGADRNERIGVKCRLLNMYMNFALAWRDETWLGDQVSVRICVVCQPHNDGYSAPSYTQIFNDASVTALRNMNNVHQFRILWDRTYQLADLTRVRTRKIRIPLKKVLKYATNDSIEQNAIYVLSTYDGHTVEDPPTIDPPLLGFNIRFTFTDY